MSTMEALHIRDVLSSLKKNLVTVPIIANDFEETRAMNIYANVIQNPYVGMDDFEEECNMDIAPKKGIMDIAPNVASTSSTPVQQTQPLVLRSLLQCLYNAKHPEGKRTSTKLDLMQLLNDIKEFVAKTLIKELDIAKYKITKKKIKEDLDFIFKNVDSLQNLNVFKDGARTLLIVASRYLKTDIVVKGDMELDVPYRASKPDREEPRVQLSIECSQGCFNVSV